MAKVNICNVEVLDNPASFFDPFKFQITFECHEPLDDDLEWKLVYVSSAYNPSLDQTLDSILVGPVPVGRHQFLFEADPPDPKIIPNEDVVGVTVVLIQALYRGSEFIRVGYYVNNEYKKEELRLDPPAEPLLDEVLGIISLSYDRHASNLVVNAHNIKLERHIIASDPRVTRFPIDWGDGLLDGCPEPEQPPDDPDEPNALDIEDQTENISHTDQENESEISKLDTSTAPETAPNVQFTGNASSMPLHQVQSSIVSVDSC